MKKLYLPPVLVLLLLAGTNAPLQAQPGGNLLVRDTVARVRN